MADVVFDRPHPDGDAAEASAVAQLQERVDGVSEATARRFLVARGWRLDAAAEMLQAHLAWRAATLPIDEESVRAVLETGKAFARGEDRTGHALLQVQAARNNPNTRDLDATTSAVLLVLERLFQSVGDDGKISLLVNRTGATRANADMPLFKHLVGIVLANYPERVHRIVVFPAPNGFFFNTVVWPIVSRQLDPYTASKIVRCRNEAEVQEYVAAEWVPEEIGGTMAV